jgi:hypothetical protein
VYDAAGGASETGESCPGGVASAARIGDPHPVQNCAPSWFCAPQLVQKAMLVLFVKLNQLYCKLIGLATDLLQGEENPWG